jgi:hypothetical protein
MGNSLVGPAWARTNALYAAYLWWDTSRMEPWCRLNPAHSVEQTMIMSEVKIPWRIRDKTAKHTEGKEKGSERSWPFVVFGGISSKVGTTWG